MDGTQDNFRNFSLAAGQFVKSFAKGENHGVVQGLNLRRFFPVEGLFLSLDWS